MRGDSTKTTKKDIINTSIDLFARHGIQNVSMESLANQIRVAKGTIYHHFKGGKDEIVDNIIILFDEVIKRNTPNRSECIDINADAASVLSKCFFVIREEDSEKCRKINRIIFSDQHYNERIRRYVVDDIIVKRELELSSCFEKLINHGKVAPFDTAAAARMLNRIHITYAMEDSHYTTFMPNELPIGLANLQKDCMRIVRQILDGKFAP